MICNVQASKEYCDAPNFEICSETDRNALSKMPKLEYSLKHFPECSNLLMQTLFCNSGAQSLDRTIAQISIACRNACLNNNIFHENVDAAMKLTHTKSKFEAQSVKNGYIFSTFVSCHTFTTLSLFQPLAEAVLIERLRIVNISAHYFVMAVGTGIEYLSYTACAIRKPEDGHTCSIIDSSTLYNEPKGLSNNPRVHFEVICHNQILRI